MQSQYGEVLRLMIASLLGNSGLDVAAYQAEFACRAINISLIPSNSPKMRCKFCLIGRNIQTAIPQQRRDHQAQNFAILALHSIAPIGMRKIRRHPFKI